MKSIIFNQHQVNHALKNKEGMFREVCKKQPQGEMEKPYVIRDMGIGAFHYPFGKCPYQIGQKIFVKETFSDERFGASLIYKAGNVIEKITHWRTASNMKQEHSRLTLRIKSVKVERLQDISEEDCWKEGLDLDSEHSRLCFNIEEQPYSNDLINGSAIKTIFTKNWNSTHKKPEEKWEANPFVFCFSYEVVR